MASILNKIAAAFSSPLGLFVLTMAMLAVTALLLWAFWRKNDVQTSSTVAQEGPLPTAKPPLLSPNMFTAGSTTLEPREMLIRNGLLTAMAVIAVMVVWQLATHRPVIVEQYDDVYADATYDDDVMVVTAASLPAVPSYHGFDVSRLVCDEGILPASYGTSYRLCSPTQAAQLDIISFAREGTALLDPSWTNSAGATVSAANQATPFRLDDTVEMVPAAGSNLGDYDAFIAIGLSDDASSDESASHQAAADRGFAVGRFVLDSLRGDVEADCTSNATVYALSVAAPAETMGDLTRLQPVLVGVKFDGRFNVEDRDADALIDDFIRSQGARITGYNLRDYSGVRKLFSEKACNRAL
ncbi:hypothetical protein [Parvularcula sp. LCG005]|uniref:hypothetical protein n=1 Tax=Parvularcula sp. LCG005 TaxID=3078805 RepID=UPI00294223E1|nr:hypothetical protein [Parvularcula sp. LCG005]WOI53395.1 hypothetical protein RUI03_00025 [Parvularcula sp. LCG005]